MQCVQCWNEIGKLAYRCIVCNEIFCSQKCLGEHTKDVSEDLERQQRDAEFYDQQIEFQDEYPSTDRYELANKYPWEK